MQAILQFFAAEIRNANTRRAYLRAAENFLRFAGERPGGDDLQSISSLDIAAWLESMSQSGQTIPTIKARLAAVRMLFQALTRERILRSNPAAVVRGPKYSIRRGKTPVLSAAETRQLLDSIPADTIVGLRDRAFIAAMVYSFARVGAVTALRVEDVFIQNRRLWLRLREKGGKELPVPCHHTLEEYLTAYLDAAELRQHPRAFVFQTIDRQAKQAAGIVRLSGKPIPQPSAWAMLQRRARSASIATEICNHTFRATGITTYLQNGGTIERAAHIANHSSTRTTQLYDRRPDDVTLDEIERIQI